MKAITVEPKKPETAHLEDIPEPDARDGSVLVEAVAVGVCGTDVEIVEGKYGWAPPGKTRLVLGHESLGRVVDPGPTGGLKKGDLVVGIVRRPDPVPCPNCAVGEWDMCRNGQYTERGIKADRRLHVRALADRARVRHEGRPLTRPPRRAARAHDGRHQGVGAGRRGRPARLLGAADRARDRCWADRSSRRPRRKAATGWRSTSSTGSSRGPSLNSCAPSAQPTTPAPLQASDSSRTSSSNAPASGRSSADSIRAIGAGGVVCLTGVGTGGPRYRARHGRRGGWSGAAEQRRCWQRQCQQAALVQGRRSSGPRGPLVAGAPRHATRATGGLHARLAAAARGHQGRRPVRRGVIGRRHHLA